MIKTFLKTTVAVATLMTGSNVWGASAYTPGTAYGDTRVDTVLLGTPGDFSLATSPDSGVKKLIINLSSDGTAGANTTNNTPITYFPNTVKEMWIRGEARSLNTVIASALFALPTPPSGCVVHFDLTTSPTGSPSAWFVTTPTDIQIVLEKGSADPKLPLAYYQNAAKIIMGMSISLANPVLNASIERQSSVREKDASALARLTVTGAGTFNKKVKGISYTGGVALTFNEDAELVDVGTVPSGITMAKGKKLKIKGVNAAPVFPASTAVTLNSGSKIEVDFNQQ